jgi:hypothetical protein
MMAAPSTSGRGRRGGKREARETSDGWSEKTGVAGKKRKKAG